MALCHHTELPCPQAPSLSCPVANACEVCGWCSPLVKTRLKGWPEQPYCLLQGLFLPCFPGWGGSHAYLAWWRLCQDGPAAATCAVAVSDWLSQNLVACHECGLQLCSLLLQRPHGTISTVSEQRPPQGQSRGTGTALNPVTHPTCFQQSECTQMREAWLQDSRIYRGSIPGIPVVP